MNESLLKELQQEAKSTRRLLERVPADKLAWSPHPKSMTLGALAIHIARLPGGMTRVAQMPQFDISTPNPPVTPANADEILAAFDKSIDDASAYLSTLSPET